MGRPWGKVKGMEGTGCRIAMLFQTVTVILGKAEVKNKEGGGWQEMVSTLHKAKAQFSLAWFYSRHKARICSSTLSEPRTFRVEHWQARALKAKAGKVGGVGNQGGGGELLRVWYQLLPKCRDPLLSLPDKAMEARSPPEDKRSQFKEGENLSCTFQAGAPHRGR